MSKNKEYHITLNKQQIHGISYGVIALGQNITIDNVKHELILISKKEYDKLKGVKNG